VAVAIDASHPGFQSYSSNAFGDLPGQCNSSRIGFLTNFSPEKR